MKSFRKYINESFLDIKDDPFGFIHPNGKILIAPKDAHTHSQFSNRLGVGSRYLANKKGYVRWRVTAEGDANFSFLYGVDDSLERIKDFIMDNEDVIKRVFAEGFSPEDTIQNKDSILFLINRDPPKKAISKINQEILTLDLKEEIILEYSIYESWGYILPDGKVVKGKESDVKTVYRNKEDERETDGHRNLSKRLGYSSNDDAMKKGCVRWYIGSDKFGSGFMFASEKFYFAIIQNILDFVNDNKSYIKGNIVIDNLVGEPGDRAPYGYYTASELLRELHKILKTNIKEAGFNRQFWRDNLKEDGYSLLNYLAFGLITPEGKIMQGDDSDHRKKDLGMSHEKVARELGYKSLPDALLHGCVRWILTMRHELVIDIRSRKHLKQNLSDARDLIMIKRREAKTIAIDIIQPGSFMKDKWFYNDAGGAIDYIDKLISSLPGTEPKALDTPANLSV